MNQRMGPVSYRPFRTEPVLADGLLAVPREGAGDLLARTSEALFRFAAEQGQIADRKAQRAGARAGEQAALAGRPNADIEGGEAPIGGHGKARGGRFSAEVNSAIERAAAEEGVDAGDLATIAQIESGGNPRAKNPRSSAGGLFQQIDANAAQYGVADRFDAYQSAKGAAKFMKDNAAYLRRNLGRQPTRGELYLAHQQGPAGAAKLLRNPDAPAASVVGAEAVRLNGGRPGMTAGQFAGLWTKRVGGGYVLPSDPGQIAPAANGKLSMSGGTWRPSGSDTIYGRAYDEAGAKTYLQMVDTEMRTTVSKTFDVYKDDPAALEKALGVLKGELKKDHIFGEIEADYEVGFDRLAGGYLEQSRKRLELRRQQEDRASFVESTAQLETDQQKMLAEYDPATDTAADSIASSQDAIDQHYDDAVARGVMDPDDAAKAKVESRRNTALAFYQKQADLLNADGVKGMRDKMEKDFAEGGVAGLDGEGWATLNAGLKRSERSKRLEGERVTGDLRERGDKMAFRLLAGVDVNQAELSKLMLDAGKQEGGKAVVQETLAKISAGRALRDMDLQDAQKHVAGLRKQYGEKPTESQLRTLAFAEKMYEEKRKAIMTDSVSYAEQNGIVPPTPLLTEAKTAEDMSVIMASRAKAAEQAATELGAPVRYLKAGEAAALGKAIRANPESGASLAAAIVAGAGTAAPKVLTEFGQDAPMIAESGAIVAFGGSQRAAEDVIAGYGKGIDGKQLKGLKPEAARMSYREVAGDALKLAPKDGERIERAAAAIARKRIADEGVDPTGDEAEGIHAQAVQEAAGAIFDRGVQFGGFATVGGGLIASGQKVLIPSELRADRFDEVLAAITDDDFAALPVKPKAAAGFSVFGFDPLAPVVDRRKAGLAETLRGAMPVSVAGGFAFAHGDPAGDDPQWIMGDDGKPFVLDIVKLRARLGPRVPGAFR